MVVQTVTVVGAAIGSLSAGIVVKYGRLKCLIVSNIILIIGCFLQIFYTNFGLFNVGRLLYGLAVGGFSVFSNQYVSEIAPKEVSGPAGSLMQVTVVCGGLIPTAFGFVNLEPDDDALQKEVLYSLILIPVGVAALQLLLLLTIYRIDTPVYYNQKGDMASMRRALGYVYKPHAIEHKVNELLHRDENTLTDENQDEQDEVTYHDICCNPLFRKATYVGITLAICQ